MKDNYPHKKHGDRTEIVETTVIPENYGMSSVSPQGTSGTVSSGQTVSQTTGTMPLVSEPRVVSSTVEPGFVTSTTPIVGQETIGQPGQVVRKIIDKTTIEHHEGHGSTKEKIKEKAKDAKDKILGFIPNPFSHKDKTTDTHLGTTTGTTGLSTNMPVETTTYTTTQPLNQPMTTNFPQTTTSLPLSQTANIPTSTTFPTTSTVPQASSSYYAESSMTKTSIPQSTVIGQTTTTIPQSTVIGQTSTTIPQTTVLPQTGMPVTTKTVTHIPSTGTTHLSCDEKKTL
jgi:hypothetical protein